MWKLYLFLSLDNLSSAGACKISSTVMLTALRGIGEEDFRLKFVIYRGEENVFIVLREDAADSVQGSEHSNLWFCQQRCPSHSLFTSTSRSSFSLSLTFIAHNVTRRRYASKRSILFAFQSPSYSCYFMPPQLVHKQMYSQEAKWK